MQHEREGVMSVTNTHSVLTQIESNDQRVQMEVYLLTLPVLSDRLYDTNGVGVNSNIFTL